MQGSVSALRVIRRAALVRNYSSTIQAPTATAAASSNNETLQYLDRLKDLEIEFQSKGEHVSADFWKTEPGKYHDKSLDIAGQEGK